jgi:hypothetical protein
MKSISLMHPIYLFRLPDKAPEKTCLKINHAIQFQKAATDSNHHP